jgi:hypothetical protein
MVLQNIINDIPMYFIVTTPVSSLSFLIILSLVVKSPIKPKFYLLYFKGFQLSNNVNNVNI